jgi:drug/metabolite transporter (DMT)-like permease
LQGDFVALMAAASFAMAMTVARRAKGVSMVPAVTLSSLGVAALVLPFASPFVLSGNDPVYILLHGAIFIPVSTSLLAIGPRFITAPEVALLILLESVLAPIVVWLVLGENPGPMALIGGTIILGALAVSNYVALRRRKVTP